MWLVYLRFDDIRTGSKEGVRRLLMLAEHHGLSTVSHSYATSLHTNPLSRRDYTELQALIFQGGKRGFSALNALLLGWKADSSQR